MKNINDIEIKNHYQYHRLCADFLPFIGMSTVDEIRLHRFTADANLRIIDYVSSNGKLTDDYVLNMVKKSEPLFNSCLNDSQKKDFNDIYSKL